MLIKLMSGGKAIGKIILFTRISQVRSISVARYVHSLLSVVAYPCLFGRKPSSRMFVQVLCHNPILTFRSSEMDK